MHIPPESSITSLTPFARRVLLAAGLTIGLLLLVMTLWYAVGALLLTFAGVLLAIMIRTPADWLAQRFGISDRWALGLVLIVLLGALVALGLLAAPPVFEQIQQLQQRLPEAIAQSRQWLAQSLWGQWLLDMIPTQQDAQDSVYQGLGRALGLAYGAAQAFFGILVLLFVSLYLAVHPRLYTSGVLHLFPFAARPRMAEVLGAVGYTLRWWLFATFIRMVAVGIMTFVGLWLLGIPLAFLLALVAFLLDFVPYFGPILAAVPAVLLASTQGPQEALYVMGLYIVVQQIESLVISPYLYQRTVYLPPVLTILAQILLFAMAGALGGVLATPLMAVAVVLVKMLYVEQTLGDYDIQTPEEALGPADRPPLPGSQGDACAVPLPKSQDR